MIMPQYEVHPYHMLGKAGKLTKGLIVFMAYAAWGFYAAVMCIVLVLTVKELIDGRLPILEMIELGVIIFFLRGFWGTICMMAAHVCFEAEGLWVHWPLRKPVMLPWTSFQQICICPGYVFKKDIPSVGLCFVRHGEKKNVYDRWKVLPTHYRTVIYIEYTPELHEGLKERCPTEIIDLRNRGGYREV